MANAPLRGCPTCGTRIADVDMGLRDYRWVSKYLPGRVAPSDLDAVLETNGNFLVMEYKPPGAKLPNGQRIMLKRLVLKGFDVWVVWGNGPIVELGVMDRYGCFPEVVKLDLDALGARVALWFDEHKKEDAT